MQQRENKESGQICQQLGSLKTSITCFKKHPITRICDSSNCSSSAMFCANNDCEIARAHLHCRSCAIQKFYHLLQVKAEGPFSEFLMRASQIQAQFVAEIQRRPQKKSQNLVLDDLATILDKKWYKIVEDIIDNQNSSALSGNEAHELFQQLQQTQLEEQSKQEQLLQTFAEQCGRLQKEYINVRNLIFDSAAGLDRLKQRTQKKEDVLPVDSKILHSKNMELQLQDILSSRSLSKVKALSQLIREQLDKQDKLSLKENLGNVVRLELLYRASDHDYSSLKFHQLCDTATNTLVLLRNQYGRSFAGYTPLSWSGEGVYKQDPNNKSFLYSFDEQIRLNLNPGSNAIYCHPNNGPTFGGAPYMFQMLKNYDLHISDKCNKNQQSTIQLQPISYCIVHQEKRAPCLIRSESEKNFKIKDYEVYRVIYGRRE